MMQKMKLGGLEQSVRALTNLLDTKDKDGRPTKFPFSLSYRLTHLLEGMQKELAYFLAEKQKLVETHAQRDEDGEIITTPLENGTYTVAIQPDRINEFEASYLELCEVESALEYEPIAGLFDFLMEKDIETDMADAIALQQFIAPDNKNGH